MIPSFWHLTAGGRSVVLTRGAQPLPRLGWFGPVLSCRDEAEAAAFQIPPARPPASLDVPVLPSLCPVTALGWFGQPGLETDCPVIFARAGVVQDGQRLRVSARSGDLLWQQTLTLHDSGVLEISSRVENHGEGPLRLHACAAAVIELPPDASEILCFDGGWTEEFQQRSVSLPVGMFSRETRRGRTSHDSFPGLIVHDPEGRQHLAAHLGWSGNHRLVVERLRDGTRMLLLGEALMPGEVVLAPGEVYQSPSAHLWVSDSGLDGIRQTAHRHLRAIGPVRRPRPIHLNTWEAVYFDHDPQALHGLIEAAAAVGVERFVLDDGWFRGRHNDRAGLGDWTADPGKYPDGLGPLFAAITGAGMEAGLWVEPEMVNPDSDLYRAHPDWCLHVPGADRPTARNQLVLDLARHEVTDYLFAALDRLLREHPIAYLKWDMNRDLAPGWGPGGWRFRRQTIALYGLLDRLRAAHPDVEIESCASGGGRADWEILRRTDRIWTSDSNDARDRAVIQQGFSLFFPPEVMGSHIGPDICHTSGRRLALTTRGHVALFGHMGIEWDIRGLSDADRQRLSELLALHKHWRPLLHGGSAVTLPLDPARALGWGVTGGDRALFCLYHRESAQDPLAVRLTGLEPEASYGVSRVDQGPDWPGSGGVYPARLLMGQGLLLPLHRPDTTLLLSAEKTS